jgi:hypothetical protein
MAAPGSEKKERVIHTRVPESLDDEIKRKATDLGLSVSNLVRNILQHTVGLVEDIVHDRPRSPFGAPHQSGVHRRFARGRRRAGGHRSRASGRLAPGDPQRQRRLRHLQRHLAKGEPRRSRHSCRWRADPLPLSDLSEGAGCR